MRRGAGDCPRRDVTSVAEDGRTVYNVDPFAISECQRNRVDWRARCRAAESRAERAEAFLHEAHDGVVDGANAAMAIAMVLDGDNGEATSASVGWSAVEKRQRALVARIAAHLSEPKE